MNIRRGVTPDEARSCAEMMSTSEPWITIGRTFDDCVAFVSDPSREVWVAYDDDLIRGFIVLVMHGAFVGYIQTICIAAETRGSGLGSQLIAFAEERVFADSPNVFLCVSSFNPRARVLYERLGYQAIGEIPDYLLRGKSELLMRKSIGPIREFRKKR